MRDDRQRLLDLQEAIAQYDQAQKCWQQQDQ
jgi:hypothetical protein